jgi:tRNA dimethylallyltransferase
MLENGALDEVRTLSHLALDPALPAMKALGVPHLLGYLKGELTLEEARRLGQQATRHYVKRQLTWFSRQIIADVVINSQYNERSLDEIFPKISEFILTNRV